MDHFPVCEFVDHRFRYWFVPVISRKRIALLLNAHGFFESANV